MSFIISSLQKDEITIVAIEVPEVRVPIEQMPLVANEGDGVFACSLTLSVLASSGTAVYGFVTYLISFYSDAECMSKYIDLIFDESKKTNSPCSFEKTGWGKCISSLSKKTCDIEKAEHDKHRIWEACSPFM